ncbi:unnamed protein product [Ambrosiozyma monospora]|uniref:Unnamed protein product n=1 Tax=Ambrosiozyma monospora TaxID=43982 RepID=A0A9W7DE48_AMBMO|nr:unnamed protein product [Ambrosiozyma monospora]
MSDIIEKKITQTSVDEVNSSSSLEKGLAPQISVKDLSATEGNDPALSKKIFLINDALDEIGFTWYHAKLFGIAGFGYSVDSQMEMIQSAVKTYVNYQFGVQYPIHTEIFYAALIVGSIVFGFGSDIIGRKLCFNSSLLLSAVFGLFTGGTSSYAMYCIFLFLSTTCAGGNIATDVSVFLEYLPSKYHYLNTSMAAWWGVGQTIANLISWAFSSKFCSDPDNCTSKLNRGWRYCWYVNSAIVLVAGLIRLFVLKLDETPKFLISVGKDEEAYEAIMKISRKYNRPCSLTLEQLKECGDIKEEYYNYSKHGASISALWKVTKANIKILFSTKVVTRSTTLILLSWLFIGVAYSTFYNFLYIYISEHGGSTGSSIYITYRNSSIANFVGIFGPFLAGLLVMVPRLGRRGTMAVSAVASMAVLFGYTTVRTPAGDAGFSSATYFFINAYYACLYAYTPEVFPTRARTTGVGLALVACRVSGAFAPVIYWFGEESGSSVPIWVCGALIGCLAILAVLMPFEPSKQRSV